MFFWLILGAGSMYVLSRKINEVPIIDKAPAPVKYTYTTINNVYDKLTATSIGGIKNFIHSVEMIGRNSFGIPIYDVFFKNGTKARVHGDENGPKL